VTGLEGFRLTRSDTFHRPFYLPASNYQAICDLFHLLTLHKILEPMSQEIASNFFTTLGKNIHSLGDGHPVIIAATA
jgi:hypothetical protein